MKQLFAEESKQAIVPANIRWRNRTPGFPSFRGKLPPLSDPHFSSACRFLVSNYYRRGITRRVLLGAGTIIRPTGWIGNYCSSRRRMRIKGSRVKSRERRIGETRVSSEKE